MNSPFILKTHALLLATFLFGCAAPTPPSATPTTAPPVDLAATPSLNPTLSPVPTIRFTRTPTLKPTSDLIPTLIAMGPMIAVTFDGLDCKVDGPTTLVIGDQVFKFTYTTDGQAFLGLARNYPGKSWQDVLNFLGEPGSQHDTFPVWISMLGYKKSVYESSSVHYYLFEFTVAGEYHMIAEYPRGSWWPCGPFSVRTAP